VIVVAAMLVGFIPFTGLSAQADGTLIRIQTAARPGKWITGQAVGITADSIGIVPVKPPDTLRYERGELLRMDVSQGRKSNAGRGALIGSGAGLVAGLIWYATIDCTSDNPFDYACPVVATEIALIATASGAATGAIIGAFSHRERWKGVKLGPQVSAALQGHRGVGLTIEF
jgi:hypothetical protein